ncbi:SNF2 family N-terminal domain-containing protein [Trichoderma chlorosporum]
MTPLPSETPPAARQPGKKSHKSNTETKRESNRPVKSANPVVKLERDEDEDIGLTPDPKKGIFKRFMRQPTVDALQKTQSAPSNGSQHQTQAAIASNTADRVVHQKVDSSTPNATQSMPRENSHNKLGAAGRRNESDAPVKVEDGLPQKTKGTKISAFQEKADKTDRTETIAKPGQVCGGDVAIPQSPNRHSSANCQQTQDSDDPAGKSLSQEKQNGAGSEEPSQDEASAKGAEAAECEGVKDVQQSAISAEVTEATEKSRRKSEKKRKRKHSRKRSKSRGHSKSHKRRKESKSSMPDRERDDDDSSGDEEPSPDEFDAEQARARLPKEVDMRHEGDQKEELRDGKKIIKSKRFLKIMRTTLKEHQIATLSWMLTREKDSERIATGGIMAHNMGTGKTVTSLASIAAHRLPKKYRKRDRACRATLVVVPNKVLAIQWMGEARKHWHEEASSLVMLYDPKADNPTKLYENQLIVIATYNQVRNDFPEEDAMQALNDQYAGDRVTLDQEFREQADDLFQIKWFRVILDEGHAINRWAGRTFEACSRLQAEHRWILTGTPIQNEAMEIFSFASFLKAAFLGSRRGFKKEYVVDKLTNDDFDTFCSLFVHRVLPGGELDIPPTTHREICIEVSQEEEMICKALYDFFKVLEEEAERKKGDAKLPKFENEEDEDEGEDVQPEEGDPDQESKKKESRALPSMQLRIRQALSHFYCLQKFLMGKYLTEDQLKSLVSDLKSIDEKKTVIEQLEADEDFEDNLGYYQKGLDQLKSRKEAFLGGNFNMDEMLDLLLLQSNVNQQKCGRSTCESQDLSCFKCGHMYCRSCLGRLMTARSNLPESERSGNYMRCSIDGCGEELLFGQPVTTLGKLAAGASKDKSYVEIGRDSIKSTARSRLERWPFFAASFYNPRIVPPPSSRLTATMAVVLTWLAEAPEDKIIIFTQFLATLKMIGCQLEALGIKFVYYTGALSKGKQKAAMAAFKNDPKTMVMVATMKSGGQAHNITEANRVIIVDLWWNKATEKQAVGRVARMGQTKETYSVRIVTKHNMDDHVIEIQTEKEAMVARLLQDDEHKRIEVDDKRLEEIFEQKECEQAGQRKRKRKKLPFE